MAKIDRRSAMSAVAAGAATLGAGSLADTAAGVEPQEPQLWTLEGELKVHPKFLYRYYLVLLDGQKCALYCSDRSREMELARLPVSSIVRVRGVLETAHHTGGTQDNPSAFPAGWWVYMQVHEVVALK